MDSASTPARKAGRIALWIAGIMAAGYAVLTVATSVGRTGSFNTGILVVAVLSFLVWYGVVFAIAWLIIKAWRSRRQAKPTER